MWSYEDRDGRESFRVYRFDSTDRHTGAPTKEFRPVHRTTAGWIIGDPSGPLPLYCLPDLGGAERIYIAEGEKATDLLRGLGVVATTSAHGAQSPARTDWSPLAGKDVVIMPDHDQSGEGYAGKVGQILARLDPAPRVTIIRMSDLWRTSTPIPEGADAAEWLQEGVPDAWTEAECRDALEGAVTAGTPCTPGDEPTPAIDPARLAGLPRTDVGNGERLVARSGRDIHFCHPWSKWLVYDGARWSPDNLGMIDRSGKATARAILAEAATIADDEDRKAHVAWWRSSESRSRIDAMLDRAASEEGVPILPEHLDADPWLLNVRNGTIDLRTGKLRPHRREDLITCLAPVKFDPTATSQLWDGILDKVFAGNHEMIRFIQRLFGLSLTGEVSEQVLPIFYGSGANGKSTLLTVILEMLGEDYAMMAPPGLLTIKRGETHPTERAALFGKRLVVDMESAEGDRLNEAWVKQLTGSDKISARRMREDFWTFAPTHKIILGTNHRPVIRETKHAIWRRVKLVPFMVTISEPEQIPDLPKRLRAEHPGILTWCVRGCLDWQQRGLAVPEEVAQATKEYRAEQDVLGDFLAEECVANLDLKHQLKAKASALYERYRKFTEGSGEPSLTQKTFGTALTERGFERFTGNGTWYRGLGLRSDSDQTSDSGY